MMDIQLHYTEKGSGEPILLLHGNGGSGAYFVHQIDPLAERFRMITVDSRGHGASPRGTAPFTIAQFADDLRALMDRLHIGRAILLGFSDGANVAMRFAVRYPDRVRALILNGGNLVPSGVRAAVQIPIEIGYRIARVRLRITGKGRSNAELLGLMVNDPMLTAEEIGRFNFPVLVIAGTKDMIRTEHTKRIAACIPGSDLVFIEGDHFIAARSPEAFNRAVLRFLNDHELTGGSVHAQT